MQGMDQCMTRVKPFYLLTLSVWRKRLWPLLRRPWLWLPLCLVLVLALADRLFPLPLPSDDLARVVLAEDGTPLWRFADRDGVWRYPVSPDQVSPYYLEALLTYEDRWFYQHPGVNPLALGRAAWQNLSGGRVLSGGSTLSMQVARLLDPHARTTAASSSSCGAPCSWSGICPRLKSSRSTSTAPHLVAPCKAWRPPVGPIWVNHPDS
jgi:penicillin-binding protein 1C